jgi:hypothetical protein
VALSSLFLLFIPWLLHVPSWGGMLCNGNWLEWQWIRFLFGNVCYPGSRSRNWEYGRRDPSRWPRGTFYPQKLALTSPACGGRSVDIVRSLTQAMEDTLYSTELICLLVQWQPRFGRPLWEFFEELNDIDLESEYKVHWRTCATDRDNMTGQISQAVILELTVHKC